MGYTHYFAYDARDQEFRDAWPQIVTDARVIFTHVEERLKVPLADAMGEGQPEITDTVIAVNGSATRDRSGGPLKLRLNPWALWEEEEARGHRRWACERRDEYDRMGCLWDFCVTRRRPYDVAVSALLLRVDHLVPTAFAIASDGSWEREWRLGACCDDPGHRPGRTTAIAVLEDVFDQACPESIHPLCKGRKLETEGLAAAERG